MAKKTVNVPVVMQMEALECGAAALSMVLAYHGKWVPLEQLREDCGVSRDGSKAKNMLAAARMYGMKAGGYRVELPDLRKVALPCIIHWNFNHFLVFCGFTRNGALLCDPARGSVRVTMQEMEECYTGICLQFTKTPAFQPGGKPKSVMAFARKRLRGTLVPFLFIALTGLLTALVGIIDPALSRVFMDRVLSGVTPAWLTPVLFLMAGLCVVQIVLLFINSVYLLKIEGKLAIIANAEFMWHVLRLPMRFFSQRLAGDIAARQSNNQDIANILLSQFAPLGLQLCMLVFYLVVMLRYSPLLTAVGLFSVLVNLFTVQVVSRKRVNITRAQMRDTGKLYAATVSGIEMIETIKASGAEDGFFERWAGYQASVNLGDVKLTRLNQTLGVVPEFVSELSNIVVLLLGALLIMRGRFTVGMLLAFQGFLQSFLTPVQSLMSVSQSLQEMRTNMERIQDVMEYPADVPDDMLDEATRPPASPEADARAFTKLAGEVTLSHVTFGYSKLEPPLIEDFSMTVKPGARVAFVGASGCGKSTLAKLISGLYEPWSGEIRFDGRLRRDISRDAFTSSVAVVDQDITLFEDTIGENIKLWDASIEDYEVILAARDAGIHADIMRREGGYRHRMTEGGRNFSGGQRQRLEIARVLALDPTVLILDEATSALDAVTEFNVVDAINRRGVTCVVIAHRLSTIRDCDEIIVLDRGKVVERGTHAELYAKGGAYTALVTSE